MRKVIGLVAALALILLAIPIAVSAQAGVLDHVVISPVTANVTTGGTQQFTAVAEDSDNVTITGLSFTWSVVGGGGNITADGLFTAGNETGTFTNTVNVTATQGDNTTSAFATVIITEPEPEPVFDNVIISPTTANITVGDTQQFTAVARDADNVTIADAVITWEVVNGGGNITAGGLFTAGNVTGTFIDTVKVTATSDNITKSAFATVIVSAEEIEPVLASVIITPVTANLTISGTQQFTAIARDADNVTIADAVFTWAVVAGGGNITAEGLFTAGNASGTFTDTVKVTATSDNVTMSAFATVIVTAPVVEKPPVPMPPGFSQGEKKGWNGGDTPPGWDNGNKTGWGDSDTPPGFSKGEKTGWGGGVTPDAGPPTHGNQNKGKSGKK